MTPSSDESFHLTITQHRLDRFYWSRQRFTGIILTWSFGRSIVLTEYRSSSKFIWKILPTRPSSWSSVKAGSFTVWLYWLQSELNSDSVSWFVLMISGDFWEFKGDNVRIEWFDFSSEQMGKIQTQFQNFKSSKPDTSDDANSSKTYNTWQGKRRVPKNKPFIRASSTYQTQNRDQATKSCKT